jgi:hypothetical protein
MQAVYRHRWMGILTPLLSLAVPLLAQSLENTSRTVQCYAASALLRILKQPHLPGGFL